MGSCRGKGTRWETTIVRYLIEVGAIHTERRALSGGKDRGDIAGIPGAVIEAKSAARLDLAGWVAEAETERINAGARIGVVWAKRKGKTSAADGYVIMTGTTLTALLRDAGYLPTQGA